MAEVGGGATSLYISVKHGASKKAIDNKNFTGSNANPKLDIYISPEVPKARGHVFRR